MENIYFFGDGLRKNLFVVLTGFAGQIPPFPVLYRAIAVTTQPFVRYFTFLTGFIGQIQCNSLQIQCILLLLTGLYRQNTAFHCNIGPYCLVFTAIIGFQHYLLGNYSAKALILRIIFKIRQIFGRFLQRCYWDFTFKMERQR